jgi:hypothetical protein
MGAPLASSTHSAGKRGTAAKSPAMRLETVDISIELQLHNVRAGRAAPACSGCGRRLLPGEILHVFEHDKALCTLCAGRLPAEQRTAVRCERVHAAQRQLVAVRRAA